MYRYLPFQALCKQTDWSTRQIERWWRRRRVQGKASEMTRFKETSWRFVVYFFLFYYGLAVLWNVSPLRFSCIKLVAWRQMYFATGKCIFYHYVRNLALFQKPWFSDTKHCWYGWPRQVRVWLCRYSCSRFLVCLCPCHQRGCRPSCF